MSKYEGIEGRGRVTKKAIEEMQKDLIEEHNKVVGSKILKHLIGFGIHKATTETTRFPFLEVTRGGGYHVLGGVTIDVDTGEFLFYVKDMNRSVEGAEMTFTYKEFMRHIRAIPNTDKEYGAYSNYWSEYQEGNSGSKTYYGAWHQMM